MTQGAKTEAKIIGLVEDSYIPVEAQRLLTHTLTLLTRLFARSFTLLLTHSIRSLACMLARSLTYSRSLAHSLTHPLHSLAGMFAHTHTHSHERERERERERFSLHAFTFPHCLCQKLGPYARHILLNLTVYFIYPLTLSISVP